MNTSEEADAAARTQSRLWEELRARLLPVVEHGSSWCYSRSMTADDLEQGWKLHLSATILTACEVLRRVGPFLSELGALYKAPSSLQELERINAGLAHSYSQVGKFITVYPQSDEEARSLAHRLDRLMSGLTAPTVPFDFRLRDGSCVYYRYGAFRHLETMNSNGKSVLAIRDPDGRLVPDSREDGNAKPDWIPDLFPQASSHGSCAAGSEADETPLKTTYRVFRALAQRGKGGAYQAIDLSVNPPRLCILKEGRLGGEVSWDGRDGRAMVKQEENALYRLREAGVGAPRVYSSFEAENNFYLATEYIEGENLQAWLGRRQRRLAFSQILRFGLSLARIIAQIHAAGWVWRDCKPGNLIVTKELELRPLDFEGACPIDQPDSLPWSTPALAPGECRRHGVAGASPAVDLYALGATLYFLASGQFPDSDHPESIRKWRRNVPAGINDLITELLAHDPDRRPALETITRKLQRLS